MDTPKNCSPYLWHYGSRDKTKIKFDLSSSSAELNIPFSVAHLATDLKRSVHGGGSKDLLRIIGDQHGLPSEQVYTVVGGCSAANYIVFYSLLNPGDHVLIESPTYDPLFSIPRGMTGVSTDFVHRSPQDHQLGIEAINKKLKQNTRLIVLTNLHAPTSVKLNNLDEILNAVQTRNRKRKRKTYVMVDEVYMDLADDITPPAATLNEYGISTTGLSKCYGLEGLRHGVILAVPEVISDVKAFNTKCIPSNSASLETVIKEFYLYHRARILKDIKRSQQLRFKILNECLTNAGIKFQRPDGGCTVLIQLTSRDDTKFSDALLDKTGVAVTPGHFFNAPGTIRLGYMQGATQHMEEGIKTFCEFYKYWSEEQD